jgi:hypothetical protein
MKHLLLAAVAASALLSGTAHATPMLYIEVFDGTAIPANLIGGSATVGVAGGASNIGPFSDGNFSSISVSALGIPTIPTPDLSSTTINAKTNGNAATLTVLVSQTDVTSLSKLLSTFTFNALQGLNSSAVMTNFISTTNSPFAMTTQIASAALSPTVGSAGPILEPGAIPTGLFSETMEYVITYGSGHGVQSTSLTSQIVDAPEPISAAMFGVGLLGLGMVRRARKTVA